MNNGLIIFDQDVELLFVDNLPKVVIASCRKDMFSYEVRRPVVNTFDILSPVATVEPAEAQDNIEPPVELAENNIELLIVITINNIDLPIVVEPIVAQKTIQGVPKKSKSY